MSTEEATSEVDSETNNTTETNGTELTEELKGKIIKQIEYYFGNYNLPRDKFLSEQIKVDNGWISMETMGKFKRLAELSTDHKAILNALEPSALMEIDLKNNRIRRSRDCPLPETGDNLEEETIKRTIYCKGFPKDGSVNLDKLLAHFKPFGPYETIYMRHYFDKQTKAQGFKGSILIVFETVEKAQEFLNIDDVTYNKTPLIRKWNKDYLEEKAEEIKERKARKQARLEQLQKEGNKDGGSELNEIESVPRGSFLFATGFTNTTTRENIKASLQEFTDDVAFLDFSIGNTEGYIRLNTPFSNKDVLDRIKKGKLKVNGQDITVRLVEGEEEDEQIKKAEAGRSKMLTQPKKRKFKGRGGGGGGGRSNKRRRY